MAENRIVLSQLHIKGTPTRPRNTLRKEEEVFSVSNLPCFAEGTKGTERVWGGLVFLCLREKGTPLQVTVFWGKIAARPQERPAPVPA